MMKTSKLVLTVLPVCGAGPGGPCSGAGDGFGSAWPR